jgi:hypothetical protein
LKNALIFALAMTGRTRLQRNLATAAILMKWKAPLISKSKVRGEKLVVVPHHRVDRSGTQTDAVGTATSDSVLVLAD